MGENRGKRSDQNALTGFAGSLIGLVEQERGRQLFAEDEMMVTLKGTVVPAVALAAVAVVVVALILWLR